MYGPIVLYREHTSSSYKYLPLNSEEDLNRYPISLRRELFINLPICRLLFTPSVNNLGLGKFQLALREIGGTMWYLNIMMAYMDNEFFL